MRTTLTLDDVVARLRRLRGANKGQKRLINDVLRLGLDRIEQQTPSDWPDVQTETFHLGARTPNLDNVAEVLATSETEHWR